jgi:hypothetical protein
VSKFIKFKTYRVFTRNSYITYNNNVFDFVITAQIRGRRFQAIIYK